MNCAVIVSSGGGGVALRQQIIAAVTSSSSFLPPADRPTATNGYTPPLPSHLVLSSAYTPHTLFYANLVSLTFSSVSAVNPA